MFTDKELFHFIDRAGKATWAGSGEPLVKPERDGFHELLFTEGEYTYKDSFAGGLRSWGTELVRYQGKPIWNSLYGGGMTDGKETLADDTYTFLKKALGKDEYGFDSFRGPHTFSEDKWEYRYTQEGNMESFHGYEEIFFNSELVHYYRIIGGLVK